MAKAIKSEQIRDRFIELFNNGTLNYSDELQIFEAIIQRYKPMTITNFSNKVGKSYNGVKLAILENRLPSKEIDGERFVFAGLT